MVQALRPTPSEAWWRTRSIVTRRSSGRRCGLERWRGNELNTELGARYSTRWLRSGCPIRTAPGDSATGTGRSAICSGPCNNADLWPISKGPSFGTGRDDAFIVVCPSIRDLVSCESQLSSSLETEDLEADVCLPIASLEPGVRRKFLRISIQWPGAKLARDHPLSTRGANAGWRTDFFV